MSSQLRSLFALMAVILLAVSAASQCIDSSCGANAKCRSAPSRGCECISGYYGRPPWTKCYPNNAPQCVDDTACPDDRACRNRLCENPCAWTCSPDHACTVKNHRAECGRGIYPTPDPVRV